MKTQWYDLQGDIFEITNIDKLNQVTYIRVYKSIFVKAKLEQDNKT